MMLDLEKEVQKLVAECLNACSGEDSIAVREQKAELSRHIEQRREHRDELQRIVSGLTILKNGMRLGCVGSQSQGAISRQHHETVRSMMAKQKGKWQQELALTRSPPLSSTVLQSQRDDAVLAKMTDVLRTQEQLLAKLRSSRSLLQLENAKKEVTKAQQSLEATEDAVRAAAKKSRKEADQMSQVFTEMAIQIGEEQERFAQNQAQLDAIARRRQAITGTMEDAFGCTEAAEQLKEHGAAVTGRTDGQQKKKEDSLPGLRLNFTHIEEDFSLEFPFKNPNDFPGLLNSISSPRGYESMVKEFEKSNRKEVRRLSAAGNETDSLTVQRKQRQRGNSISEQPTGTESSGPYSVSETPSSAKRQKIMSHDRQDEKTPVVQQKTNHETELIEEQMEVVADNGSNVKKSDQKTFKTPNPTTGSLIMKENLPSTAQPQMSERKLRQRPAPPLVHNKNVKRVLVEVQGQATAKNTKRQATTSSFPKQQKRLSPGTGDTKFAASVTEMFKTPVNAVSSKPPAKQSVPVVKQQKTPKHRPKQAARIDTSIPQTTESVREFASRRSKSPQQPQASDDPVLFPAPVDTDGENLLEPMERSMSNDSLDFALPSSLVNLSPELSKDNFEGADPDTGDYDFLRSDVPVPNFEAKKDKNDKNAGAADGFSFDFDAQNSCENMGQEDGDFF